MLEAFTALPSELVVAGMAQRLPSQVTVFGSETGRPDSTNSRQSGDFLLRAFFSKLQK
jgi:hypothetical protein